MIERAEKQSEIVIAIELEAEVDVALDDAAGVAEELRAALDATAVIEVGRGVVEEVDLASRRLKQKAHVAVRAADVEDASAIRDELRRWVDERIEVVDVVDAVVGVPIDVGARRTQRTQAFAERRHGRSQVREAHATLL